MRVSAQYIVKRVHGLFGYTEFLGPVVSTPQDIEADATRLYGKAGHLLTWVAYSKASKAEREACARAYEERGGPGDDA